VEIFANQPASSKNQLTPIVVDLSWGKKTEISCCMQFACQNCGTIFQSQRIGHIFTPISTPFVVV